MPPTLTLTNEQHDVVGHVVEWVENPTEPRKTVGGLAGTGKTTCIKAIVDALRAQGLRVLVVSLTGKAVSVLESKGVTAQTIHSYLYRPFEGPNGELFFAHNHNAEEYDLIINDEASMTNERLAKDLEAMGLVLYIGDHGQLPPVKSNFNLMADPEHLLEKIHRQAEHSQIIKAAHTIRSGKLPAPINTDELIVRRQVTDAVDVLVNLLAEGKLDIGIAAKNKTRTAINNAVRTRKGWDVDHLVVGEPVIFLHNKADLGIFNGLIGRVELIEKRKPRFWTVSIRTDDGVLLPHLDIRVDVLTGELSKDDFFRARSGGILIDYASCVTCHKAQGSEWPRVGIIGETLYGTPYGRWLYTALTRASDHAHLLIPS